MDPRASSAQAGALVVDRFFLREVQAEIRRLTAEAIASDEACFRSLGPEPIPFEVPALAAGRALGLIDAARALVARVLEACEALDPAGDPQHAPDFSTFVPGAVDSAVARPDLGGDVVRRISDVAFLVQLELRQRRERVVSASPELPAVVRLGEAEGAIRRVRKGLAAIDTVLVVAFSVPPTVEFTSELHDSLQVRRAFAQLRAHFAQRDVPGPGDIDAALSVASALLDSFLDGEGAPSMRVGDRLAFLGLLHRCHTWPGGASEAGARAGIRLWQDIAAFVAVLSQINRRQELVRHDREVLERLVAMPPEAFVRCGPQVAWMLAAIEGLDDELDALVRAGTTGPALFEAVRRLAGPLRRAAEGSAA